MLKTILFIVGAVLALLLLIYLVRRRREYGRRIRRLPLDLMGYPNIPAVPFILVQIPDTLIKLGLRSNATTQAKWGMSNVYTIGTQTANGYSFLYGRKEFDAHIEEKADRETLLEEMENAIEEVELSPVKLHQRFAKHAEPVSASARTTDPILKTVLTKPEQFALSWTTFNGVYDDALPLLPTYADTLRDPHTANLEFWPMIAKHGLAYNLLILVKVNAARAADYQAALGEAWTPQLQSLFLANRLYAIDLRMFASLPVSTVKDFPRFTPATLTLLGQNPDGTLTPLKVLVTGQGGSQQQIYGWQDGVTTPGAWLYALQAAKTSITLYGIWIGHVYHWHIVSAALVMTLNNHVPETHPLRVFMAPQTSYLIPFNDVLLLLWEHISPPTSVSTTPQFLQLMDDFATGRSYFEDDPDRTLIANGITPEDFGGNGWEHYPIAGQLLSVFKAAGDYVTAFVMNTWTSDAAVVADKALQAWAAATIDPRDGNVAGFPSLNSRAALISALKSWVYRLSVHGVSRLNYIANPVLSFVPNFPPCLQSATIPPVNANISTEQLLAYLPNTGTIGEMITFLFTFVFSAPYEPFLPLAGNQTGLLWGDNPAEPRNAALIAYRQFIENFIDTNAHPTQRFQWPRNIET